MSNERRLLYLEKGAAASVACGAKLLAASKFMEEEKTRLCVAPLILVSSGQRLLLSWMIPLRSTNSGCGAPPQLGLSRQAVAARYRQARLRKAASLTVRLLAGAAALTRDNLLAHGKRQKPRPRVP
jgi:hypothetical protein